VWVDYALGKSVELPQMLRDTIERALATKIG
jgi:acyl-CoA thioester hydrolase